MNFRECGRYTDRPIDNDQMGHTYQHTKGLLA